LIGSPDSLEPDSAAIADTISASGTPTSERRSLGWDVRNASRNYATLVATHLGSSLFSFATIWLVTRYLGSDGYGRLTAVLLAAQIGQIALMWTGNAMSRYGVQEFVETGMLNQAFWARTVIWLPNLLLLLASSYFWLPWLGEWLKLDRSTYPFLLFYMVAMALSMHGLAAAQGAKLIRFQSLLAFSERVLVLLVLIGFIASSRLQVEQALLAYSVPPLATGIFALWKMRSLISRFVLNVETVKRILIFSLPIPLYSVTSYLTFNHLDAIIILRYLTESDLGVYSIAYQMNGMVGQLAVSAGVLLMPMLVTSQSHDERRVRSTYFDEVLPLITFLFGVISFCVAVGSYFLIPAIMGSEFAMVGGLLVIFAAACTVNVPVQAGYLPLAYSQSATYIQLAAAGLGAAVNVLLNILLIPIYGLFGCVWATVAAFSTTAVVFALLSSRRFNLRTSAPIVAVAPAVIAAAAFAISGRQIAYAIATFLCACAVVLVTLRRSFRAGFNRVNSRRV